MPVSPTTYIIGKAFRFSAAHRLPYLPEGHKCRRPHGHNYVVSLVLMAKRELDHEAGEFVADYGDLAGFKGWIDLNLDHSDLNEAMGGVQPTAEALAWWLWEPAVQSLPSLAQDALHTVVVQETANTFAAWSPYGSPVAWTP